MQFRGRFSGAMISHALDWMRVGLAMLVGWAAGGLPEVQAATIPKARPGSVEVCRDGGAGGYEAFPDICRLKDGRLMVVFYAGYEHVSLPKPDHPTGGRIGAVYSSDEGATWSAPEVVYDGPDDDRDPSIAQLQDGRLICSFFSLRASPQGYTGLGTWLIESDDGGRTWSPPRCLTERYYCSSPVRELEGGLLILGLYRQDDAGSAGAVIRSEDGGRTWGPVIDIDSGGRRLDAETDVIALHDGSLYAVQRAPEQSMCFSRSLDQGRTWSVSEPIGFPGHCPYLMRTTNGVLLLAHRLPQTTLHYSRDDGLTWERGELVDQFIGAYPSMVSLRDGSMLIVYYEEGAGSNLRARRFRVEDDGMQWLEPADSAGAAVPGQQRLWGGLDAGVGYRDGIWRIRGARRQVEVASRDLQLTVQAGATWRTTPAKTGDLRVRRGKEIIGVRLADARGKEFSQYDTGARRGFQIVFSGFGGAQELPDIRLQLVLGLEGTAEELVCELSVLRGADSVVELAWPPPLEPASFDRTIVPFMQGMLLPNDWPRKVWLYDTLSYGRGLYMPWWGHEQGQAAMLLFLETPDDGGCHFEHPAGGPTRIQPRWVHSLGRFDEPRRLRLCFFEQGNYVDMAKRYRRHVKETGNFVSLREKIDRNPRVLKLIGSPVIHTSILYHIEPESSYYHKDAPAKNDDLVTFDARADALQQLASRGVKKAYVHLDGWGFRGYDNLHPDVLPPCPSAGGWEGMKRLAERCAKLGYVFALHDQYRDYYLDAQSYDPRNTVIEENGSRPEHSIWYGGRQSILCPSMAPAHVRKNHQTILNQGVALQGAYLDVFSVVPPDECYHPEHPVTRRACLAARAEALGSVRAWGGVVSSEEPSGWSIPHLDLVHHGPYPLDPNPGKGPAMGIPVPLFNLVYHDALFTPWSMERGAWGIPEKDLGYLHGLGNAGMPYLGLNPSQEELDRVRTMMALHARLALSELLKHEFLDGSWRRQRFSYAGGTTVTIDLDADHHEIQPSLAMP